MKKNELINKTLAGLMIAAMTAGVCPTTAFAVTGAQVAKDGTYKATAHVTRTEDDEEDEWEEYDVEVSLTVADGKFTDITVTPGDGYTSENASYFNKAYNKKSGIKTLLEGKDATADTVNGWDSVSGATRTSKAVKEAAAAAIAKAEEAATAVEVNVEKLQAAITKAEGLKEADYTADSWKTMQDALTEAKAALAAKESQDKVDAAESKLTKAIDGLVKAAAEVNTEKLQAAITKAEGLKEADYTADSWKTMQDALTEAKAALAAKESQDKVDAAEAKLTKAIDALEKNAVAKEVYVLMNIPYDKFYAAEGDDDADAVTSATLNKTRSSLAAGSYHVNSDGSDITGIVYPVKLDDASALEKLTQVTDSSKVDITVSMKGKETTTTYEGKDALFESPSYSYYILSETPSYYKEATVNADGSLSFGKAEGTEVQTLSSVTANFKTSSKYGDYEIDLSGLPEDITTVYGVVVGTKEGDSYGLRHVENIWRISELAWSTGFTTEVHGSPVQYKDYVSMMGQTINKLTYYTNAGIYEIPADIYVAVKFDGSVEVADAKASSGETKVTFNNLPSDYEAEYSVDGLENVKVENGVLTYTAADAKVGKYTLKVTDKSGKYADISASFTLTTEVTPITYDGAQKALVPADGYSADDVAAYVKNIESVSVNGKAYAASGKGAVKIINEDGTINTEAAPFAEAEDGQEFEIEVTAAGYENNYKFTYTAESQYKYVYAALTYSEYWAAEDVQAAGSTDASDVKDTHGEYDKGAFDAVSRATTNHGLHRGNFQQDVTIYDTEGNAYEMSYWKDKENIVLTDGTTIGFSKGTITLADGTTKTMANYKINGIKYVPVKVAAADYDAFKEQYNVVENGGTLAGGYSEGVLNSYADLVADVDANTNGLKEATKNADGSFSFGARQTGTGSGIQGVELQTITPTPVVQETSSYGDFIRMDIKEDYGEIGSKMQTVEWTYYGNGDTPLASYGTKFAADNWMHKSMGVQLGLTDSLRCQLPEGTDGTGKWTVTIYALGYADTTMTINVTADDIHTATPVSDTSALEAAIARAEALNEADYTADSWSAMQTELQEAKDDLAAAANGTTSQESVDESTRHLNAAIDELVKADAPVVVDTTALEAAIANAEGLNEADYTADSWAAMQTSLTSAKAALEAKESQEAVDAAAASLQASIDALVKAEAPAEVDTSALEAVIAKAEALNKSDYTEDSWDHFQTEVAYAKSVLAEKASQEAVDEAAKTLQAEIDALVKATDDDKKDETDAVDTSSLEKLIASAKDLKKNDYTAATWTTLQNALKNAESAVEAKESQKAVDAAEKNLQAAIDGLKKASATTNTNNNKKNNTTTTTKKNNTTTTSKKSPKTGDPVSVLGLLGAAVSSIGIGGLGLKLRKKSKREDEE